MMSNRIKRVLVIIMTMVMSLYFFAACDGGNNGKTLETPKNVAIDANALITWDEVEDATGYIITISGVEHVVVDNFYQASKETAFSYNIVAIAEGYNNSPRTANYSFSPNIKPVQPTDGISIAIKGSSEIKSGHSISLTPVVSGIADKSIVWSIARGSEYVTISDKGKLTASEVTGDKIVEVIATSTVDGTKKASKIITVLARPTLTQAMLNTLNSDLVSFEGYVNISLYTIDVFFPKLHSTYSTVIKTAMNGTNWYAEYEDGNTGLKNGLYFKENDGKTCQVILSFMNDESYVPLLDKDNKAISWVDGGLYNSFKTLTLSDFKFDEESWRYYYSGGDKNVVKRMTASANPYDFEPTGFALIIEDDEILGIYSKSNDDYRLVEGYRAVQELTVAVNVGETVEVPVITKFSHDAIHDDLQIAIDNMRALDSYSLDFKEITASYLTNGYIQSGFIENVTSTDCYFSPYSISYDGYGNEVHKPRQGESYGYHKIREDLYNAYLENTGATGSYQASRAFAKSFDNAKPSFAFAAEIFRMYYHDEEAGTTTYYVDPMMSSVASTFYYGVGNDINLYGIFATEGRISSTETFTPFVVVKDGHIIEACFYYYMGSMYGLVELVYSDFNDTELPENVNIQFPARELPVSWSELTIQVSEDSSSTSDDRTENALDVLKGFFDNENIELTMPFFGDPLGDTYGFGLTSYHMPVGGKTLQKCITFYYDVPLDVDYTINSSLNAIDEYLIGMGFTKNAYAEYTNGDIVVAPTDSSLDLLIYVWKNPSK